MMTVTGFDSKLAAFRFEWMWNHPKEIDEADRQLRGISFKARLRRLNRLINLPHLQYIMQNLTIETRSSCNSADRARIDEIVQVESIENAFETEIGNCS